MAGRYGAPEEPTKGNPRQLSVLQHVFPVASIRRFTDDKGRVDLRHFSRSKRRFATPRDTVFCARRAWDQRAEAGYMKSIERDYQSVVTEMLGTGVSELNHEQSFKISCFMALWQSRAHYRDRHDNVVQTGLPPEDWLTKEQEEVLESRWMTFSRPDSTIAARFMNGLAIQNKISLLLRSGLSKHRWGIVHASSGEFLVPDEPTLSVIPVTPTVCLAYDNPSGHITGENVSGINTLMYRGCKEYFFARNLSLCPVLVPLPLQITVPLTSHKD